MQAVDYPDSTTTYTFNDSWQTASTIIWELATSFDEHEHQADKEEFDRLIRQEQLIVKERKAWKEKRKWEIYS